MKNNGFKIEEKAGTGATTKMAYKMTVAHTEEADKRNLDTTAQNLTTDMRKMRKLDTTARNLTTKMRIMRNYAESMKKPGK